MSLAMRHVVDGKRVKAKSPAEVLKPGDVVFVEKKDDGNGYMLRQPPEVSGGHGGDGPAYRPRARHGRRLLLFAVGVQPRHAGYAPARLVVQADRLCGGARQWLHAGLGGAWTRRSPSRSATTVWTPKNYDGKAGGPSTLRTGIERSRNLMTVRLANDMGMKLVAEYAERFGVYDKMEPVHRDGARLGRDHRDAHGLGLFGDGQWRPPDQAVADRPHPGPLRQDRVQARRARLRRLRGDELDRTSPSRS